MVLEIACRNLGGVTGVGPPGFCGWCVGMRYSDKGRFGVWGDGIDSRLERSSMTRCKIGSELVGLVPSWLSPCGKIHLGGHL